jgi:hypothetical protein
MLAHFVGAFSVSSNEVEKVAMLAWSLSIISGELMSPMSTRRFEPKLGALYARSLLPAAGSGQNRLLCVQVTGSIAVLVLIVLSLFCDWRAQIPGSRHRDDPSPTGQKASAERHRQANLIYSSERIAAGAATAYAQILMEGLSRHRGDQASGFASGFASSDCSGRALIGYTRIFIAHRTDAKSGTGTASDPFDGSTEDKLDTLLRTRSENGLANLVVCIGPGTFQTEGVHDYLMGVGHINRTQASGFTVNRGWRVHGARMDRTILRLADLYLDPSTGGYLVGRIINTHDLDSYGVEVSDLTLDDNYPALKLRYRSALQLEAVSLRSNLGQHWIHNIHVMNAAGETTEAFPVEISSQANSPTASSGNVVEYVTMDHWASGKCTAIAIANAVTEVRYNRVIGYQIAYGGWQMSDVHFHDNYAVEAGYGFNIDSLRNDGIVIRHNQIIHPQLYGLVIGGIGQFVNFSISENMVTLASTSPTSTLYGLIFRGNVTGARVIGNRIISDQLPEPARAFGLYEQGTQNTGNVFQSNQISSSFKYELQGADCLYGNVDQSGTALRGLRNTQGTACLPGR